MAAFSKHSAGLSFQCAVALTPFTFVREPELCLSVAEAVFLCALLLFLSFTVCCAVLFVFWRTVPLWNNLKINGPRTKTLTDQEANSIGDGENDKDTSTLFVSV